MPAYVALDAKLTTAAPEPAYPARQCRDARGRDTVCNRALADYAAAVRAWGRGLASQLRQIHALQPEP